MPLLTGDRVPVDDRHDQNVETRKSPEAAIPRRTEQQTGLIASCAIAVAFAILYGWTLWQKDENFHTYAFDLGLFSQVAWNTLHGHPFATTLLGFNYLADHLAPALALLSPLFLVWPDAHALLFVQAVAAAGAGIGIYLTTYQRTNNRRAGLLLQMAYHIAPTTGWVVLDEFHPITLALPAMTFATAYLWRGRIKIATVLAALALLSTEDAVTWVIPFGFLVAWVAVKRQKIWGMALAAFATAWIVLYLFVVVPAVRPASLVRSDPHPDIGVFIYCGQTWHQIANCLLQRPDATLHQLSRPGGQDVLATIIGPTAGLGLLGPSFLAIAPRWIIQLLSINPADYTQHYVALLVPAAYLAAAETLSWLRRRRVPPRLPAALVAIASLVAFIQSAPLPGGGAYAAPTPAETARDAILRQALALVPANPALSVVATSSFFPHIALRPRAYLPWADPTTPADYRLLDLRDSYPISDAQLRTLAARWLQDANYQVLFDQDDILVLKHGYLPPQKPEKADFGHAILFQGYDATATPAGLQLTLYWQARQRISADDHYFVHLVGPNGADYSQHDATAITAPSPLNVWSTGARIRDDVTLPTPPPADWGHYHLEVGWYNWQTGQRLLLSNGQDHVTLPMPSSPRNDGN